MSSVSNMAGRPKIFDEQLALEKAANLFWKNGYGATSTEDLIIAMGLQRGSFYNTFGSKKELFINAINYHETSSFNEFKKQLAMSKTPIIVLKAAFLGLADCPKDEHKMGCFAGNTIAEFSSIDDELVENASKHLKYLEEIFFKQIKSSQQARELKTKKDARLLAKYLLNLWNGLNITRRVYPDRKLLRSLIEFQLEVIN